MWYCWYLIKEILYHIEGWSFINWQNVLSFYVIWPSHICWHTFKCLNIWPWILSYKFSIHFSRISKNFCLREALGKKLVFSSSHRNLIYFYRKRPIFRNCIVSWLNRCQISCNFWSKYFVLKCWRLKNGWMSGSYKEYHN